MPFSHLLLETSTYRSSPFLGITEEEKVRTLVPAPTQEEAQVVYSPHLYSIPSSQRFLSPEAWGEMGSFELSRGVYLRGGTEDDEIKRGMMCLSCHGGALLYQRGGMIVYSFGLFV